MWHSKVNFPFFLARVHQADTCTEKGATETFSAHPSHFLWVRPFPPFYPPDARNYQYKRHLMVAVDGSKESEHAVEWTIGHLCRSGDLLHIVHVETAGDMVSLLLVLV